MSGSGADLRVMGRTDEAMGLLKQVIAADPRRVNDTLLMGELLMRTGDYTGALGYFRRAEQAKPDTRSEVLLALCYQHLKQFDQANRYLEMAKRRSPDNPEVRAFAGRLFPGDRQLRGSDRRAQSHSQTRGRTCWLSSHMPTSWTASRQSPPGSTPRPPMPCPRIWHCSFRPRRRRWLWAQSIRPTFLDRADHLDPDHYRCTPFGERSRG